jgi:hypothetical protein
MKPVPPSLSGTLWMLLGAVELKKRKSIMKDSLAGRSNRLVHGKPFGGLRGGVDRPRDMKGRRRSGEREGGGELVSLGH